MKHIYLLQFSDTAMNLQSNVVCLVHLHIIMEVLMSLPVLQQFLIGRCSVVKVVYCVYELF